MEGGDGKGVRAVGCDLAHVVTGREEGREEGGGGSLERRIGSGERDEKKKQLGFQESRDN